MLKLPRGVLCLISEFLNNKDCSYWRATCRTIRDKVPNKSHLEQWGYQVYKSGVWMSYDNWGIITNMLELPCAPLMSFSARSWRFFDFCMEFDAPLEVFDQLILKFSDLQDWSALETTYRKHQADPVMEKLCEWIWNQIERLKPKPKTRKPTFRIRKKRKVDADEEWKPQ